MDKIFSEHLQRLKSTVLKRTTAGDTYTVAANKPAPMSFLPLG